MEDLLEFHQMIVIFHLSWARPSLNHRKDREKFGPQFEDGQCSQVPLSKMLLMNRTVRF
jgi:hypothetical protein